MLTPLCQNICLKVYFKDVYIGARKNGKELKLAFSEYYLSLVIVQDYQKFNLTGFRKINKKFDKNFFCDLGKEWFDSKVKESELNEGKDIENLITKVFMSYRHYVKLQSRSISALFQLSPKIFAYLWLQKEVYESQQQKLRIVKKI